MWYGTTRLVGGPWKRNSGALWYGTTERIWRPIGTALLGPVTRRNWSGLSFGKRVDGVRGTEPRTPFTVLP